MTGAYRAAGDANSDGIVDQEELAAVLALYWPSSPWLSMANLLGLGESQVTFAIPDSTTEAVGVKVSTNLLDWDYLGPATPRFEFMDTNAPLDVQRYYRLVWP